MHTRLLARFAIGCLIVGGSVTARAQGLDRPALLVAAPHMTGFYRQAVLLAMPKDAGHVGFIINRATRTTVAAAFPDEPDAAEVAEPIYLGGPRAAQSLYAVVKSNPGEGSRQLFGDVFVTVSGATVDRIIREAPREARYFAGFVAWDAGELAAQIARGDWLSAEPEEALLFHPNPHALWPALLERISCCRTAW